MSGLASSSARARQRAPDLLASRLGPLFQRGQKTADKVIIAATILAVSIWLVIMALDAGRYRYSLVPYPLRAAGVLAIGA